MVMPEKLEDVAASQQTSLYPRPERRGFTEISGNFVRHQGLLHPCVSSMVVMTSSYTFGTFATKLEP